MHPTSARWPAQFTASAFNWLVQYASSPGHGTYCYAELIVLLLIVVETISSTHCVCPRRDSRDELTWVAGHIRRWFAHPKMVTHPSSNCVGTIKIKTNVLPLSQTSKLANKQPNCLIQFPWRLGLTMISTALLSPWGSGRTLLFVYGYVNDCKLLE